MRRWGEKRREKNSENYSIFIGNIYIKKSIHPSSFKLQIQFALYVENMPHIKHTDENEKTINRKCSSQNVTIWNIIYRGHVHVYVDVVGNVTVFTEVHLLSLLFVPCHVHKLNVINNSCWRCTVYCTVVRLGGAHCF